MVINFVGNYSNSYTNEIADETHLARSLEQLGHQVNKVPRDVWKAYCDGYPPNDDWNLVTEADFTIVGKWHHFDKRMYIEKIREAKGGKIIYWTWDYMGWPNPPQWHLEIARASDMHLTNEGGHIMLMKERAVNAQYFPFDVADQELPISLGLKKKYDVSFFGSCFGAGHRLSWIKKINEYYPVTIFSYNPEEWEKHGLKAYKAVYGGEFNMRVAESKICLQFSVNDNCWGYWSNRVGKTFLAGGFLLAHYTPGMELSLRDGAAYFKTPEQAIEKIRYYLENECEREKIEARAIELSNHFSSIQRCRELVILLENL